MDLTLEDVWRLLGQKELELAALRKEVESLTLSARLLPMRPAPPEKEPPDGE